MEPHLELFKKEDDFSVSTLILTIVGILLILTVFLSLFYYRDVLGVEDSVGQYSCEPLDVEIVDVEATSLRVKWHTSQECLGLVKYGSNMETINFMALDEEGHKSKREHLVKIDNLKPSMTYYLVIHSDGKDYGAQSGPVVVSTDSF